MIAEKLMLMWRRRSTLRATLMNSSPTYSQYGEDVLFRRLLNPGKNGIYVDVGANHPIMGSNTFALYSRGWRGLTIEPNPAFAAAFRRHRPRDTHRTEGVSKSAAKLTYYRFSRDVFNTFDPERVKSLLGESIQPLDTTEVLCRPLSEIVDEHLPGSQIDFLNVDCEGLDLDVIVSLDLNKRRPTTIVVEDYYAYMAFRDGAQPREMESFLRQHGYRPIAQAAWSSIYIAEDWPDLFRRSSAFDPARVQNGYLPGQATLEDDS